MKTLQVDYTAIHYCLVVDYGFTSSREQSAPAQGL